MKHIKYYILLILTLFFMIGCSTPNSETIIPLDNSNPNFSEETPNLENQKNKKLIIASMENKPFKTIIDGQLTGPYIDIITTALDNIDYEYEFKIMPWNRVVESVETGKIDIGFSFFDTPKRRQFAHYMEEPIGLFSMKLFAMPNSNIKFDGSLKSIDSYNLGLVQNYFYTNEITDAIANGMMKVDKAIDSPANIEKLLNGRVDIIIEDSFAVKDYLRLNNINIKLKEFEIPIIYNYTYMVFPKGRDYDDIRKKLDIEFKAMKSNGSFYDIYRKYDLNDFADDFISMESKNPPRKKYFVGFSDLPLSIAVIADTKPYVYEEKGELTGFVIDFLSEALDRVGTNYKFTAMPFSRMLEELENGNLDIGTDIY
ncbi:MAG: transporter substrate-binding domain-containing protein, partial [Acidaminobacteraceae bacterium]